MECKQSENIKDCKCTYSCSRRGKCCECVRNHRKMGELPGCFFSKDAEKSYDRSIEKFILNKQ
ncbi:hypothetical protein HN587_03055 [Candidatus Woesearchaeota archaeon]|jgi:hypothetical protein|nr:hypothetical protein [Candidatus Woesearchaeota archaeon]